MLFQNIVNGTLGIILATGWCGLIRVFLTWLFHFEPFCKGGYPSSCHEIWSLTRYFLRDQNCVTVLYTVGHPTRENVRDTRLWGYIRWVLYVTGVICFNWHTHVVLQTVYTYSYILRINVKQRSTRICIHMFSNEWGPKACQLFQLQNIEIYSSHSMTCNSFVSKDVKVCPNPLYRLIFLLTFDLYPGYLWNGACQFFQFSVSMWHPVQVVKCSSWHTHTYSIGIVVCH